MAGAAQVARCRDAVTHQGPANGEGLVLDGDPDADIRRGELDPRVPRLEADLVGVRVGQHGLAVQVDPLPGDRVLPPVAEQIAGAAANGVRLDVTAPARALGVRAER